MSLTSTFCINSSFLVFKGISNIFRFTANKKKKHKYKGNLRNKRHCSLSTSTYTISTYIGTMPINKEDEYNILLFVIFAIKYLYLYRLRLLFFGLSKLTYFSVALCS